MDCKLAVVMQLIVRSNLWKSMGEKKAKDSIRCCCIITLAICDRRRNLVFYMSLRQVQVNILLIMVFSGTLFFRPPPPPKKKLPKTQKK